MGKWLIDVGIVIVGNILLAFGFAVFAIPANLIVGGATGVGLIVENLFGVNYATTVFLINMIMLVLGYFVLGKKFAAGTVLSSFLFPFFLGLFEVIPLFQQVTEDILLATIYAGVFSGFGLGIVFRQGYSTGGLDVPPLIAHQRFHIPLALAINGLDALILLGQVLFTDFEGILYGLITVFISSYVIERVASFGENKLQVFIISPQYEKISEAIFQKINRGCTFVNITTGYMKQSSKAVLCVADQREIRHIHDLVLQIDPEAFIINHHVHSISGRGFTLPNIDIEKKV